MVSTGTGAAVYGTACITCKAARSTEEATDPASTATASAAAAAGDHDRYALLAGVVEDVGVSATPATATTTTLVARSAVTAEPVGPIVATTPASGRGFIEKAALRSVWG